MKNKAISLAALTLLSMVSGILMSRASWVGRTGMTLFYQEYNFLKTWWKGALVVGIILAILYAVHLSVQRRKSVNTARVVHMGAIVLAIAGFFLTYSDFQNTLSHKLLGTSFHVGAYLFWIGWIAISIFFLMNSRPSINPGKIETSTP